MKTFPNELRRYDNNTRMNHWAIALLFFGAGLSGLACFHPSLFFLSNLFGGGVWTRILHPYMGVLMFLAPWAYFMAAFSNPGHDDNETLKKYKSNF